MEKVKNLINSCDNTIDPSLLKKQLDDLLEKTIKKNEEGDDDDLTTKKSLKTKKKTLSTNSIKLKNAISTAPSYNPTPIYELNKIKKEKELKSLANSFECDNEIHNSEVGDELNVNNKRFKIDDDTNAICKKSKVDISTINQQDTESSEIKKLLQQKTDSIIVSLVCKVLSKILSLKLIHL